MQRWTDVGFTSAQAELLSQLVTRDYLDQRLDELNQRLNQRLDGFVTFDHLHQQLQLQKRSILLWMVAMLAPVYATLLFIIMRLGV